MERVTTTISLTADETLQLLAQEHGTNQSVVVESAVLRFAKLPVAERDRLIRGIRASKKAYTRGRWRAAFWDAMFDEFWLAKHLRNGRRSDFTPLTFAGFQVWFLLDSLADPDPEEAAFFYVQIMANPLETRLTPAEAQHRFTFPRELSPYEAAQQVADLIRTRAIALDAFEIVEVPDGGRVLLDHAGPHWMAQPEIDPSRLPIEVKSASGSYRLEPGYILKRSDMNTTRRS